jgi:hypothetical protein
MKRAEAHQFCALDRAVASNAGRNRATEDTRPNAPPRHQARKRRDRSQPEVSETPISLRALERGGGDRPPFPKSPYFELGRRWVGLDCGVAAPRTFPHGSALAF